MSKRNIEQLLKQNDNRNLLSKSKEERKLIESPSDLLRLRKRPE